MCIRDRDGYVLTDALTPRQFSELTDMDMEICRLFYKAYAADREEYVRIINNIDAVSYTHLDVYKRQGGSPPDFPP